MTPLATHPYMTLSGLRAQRAQRMTKLRQLEWRWERAPTNMALVQEMRECREVVSDLETKIYIKETAKLVEE